MILQVKYFIHSLYFDSFGRRLHSDLLDRLKQATIRGRQAERFPRDTVLEMYLPSTLSSFSSFFFCSGNRNAKDAEMKRVLPSTIRRPHRLPPQLDCSVFVLSWPSSSFVPRVSRCSRHSRNEEKRNSQSKFLTSARSCRILLLFCFEPRRCLDDVPVRASFHLRVVLYHRDCIPRVYVIRIDPNLHGIFPFGILPWSIISPTRTSCVHSLVLSNQC